MKTLNYNQTQQLIIMLAEVPIDLKVLTVDDIQVNQNTFNIRFETIINPFGYFFSVPESLLIKVIEAIKTNLSSDMRKHAFLYRALQAQSSVLMESKLKKLRREHLIPDNISDAGNREKTYDLIGDLFAEYEQHLSQRLRNIAQYAFPGIYKKTFTEYKENISLRAA